LVYFVIVDIWLPRLRITGWTVVVTLPVACWYIVDGVVTICPITHHVGFVLFTFRFTGLPTVYTRLLRLRWRLTPLLFKPCGLFVVLLLMFDLPCFPVVLFVDCFTTTLFIVIHLVDFVDVVVWYTVGDLRYLCVVVTCVGCLHCACCVTFIVVVVAFTFVDLLPLLLLLLLLLLTFVDCEKKPRWCLCTLLVVTVVTIVVVACWLFIVTVDCCCCWCCRLLLIDDVGDLRLPIAAALTCLTLFLITRCVIARYWPCYFARLTVNNPLLNCCNIGSVRWLCCYCYVGCSIYLLVDACYYLYSQLYRFCWTRWLVVTACIYLLLIVDMVLLFTCYFDYVGCLFHCPLLFRCSLLLLFVIVCIGILRCPLYCPLLLLLIVYWPRLAPVTALTLFSPLLDCGLHPLLLLPLLLLHIMCWPTCVPLVAATVRLLPYCVWIVCLWLLWPWLLYLVDVFTDPVTFFCFLIICPTCYCCIYQTWFVTGLLTLIWHLPLPLLTLRCCCCVDSLLLLHYIDDYVERCCCDIVNLHSSIVVTPLLIVIVSYCIGAHLRYLHSQFYVVNDGSVVQFGVGCWR